MTSSPSPPPDPNTEETLALLRHKESSVSSDSHGSELAKGTHIFQISEPEKQEKQRQEHGEFASAIFNLSTSIIGAGIMALPAAMRVLGLPLGAAAIATMGVVSQVSIEIVIHSCSKLGSSTYGHLVAAALERQWARIASTLAVIVNNAGILIVYLIIVGDVLCGDGDHGGLLTQWSRRHFDRKLVMLAAMCIVLAPLSSLRRIDSLRFSSAASVALAILFVVLCCAAAIVKGIHGELPPPGLLPSFDSSASILELLTVVPIMTNAFICHFNIPPIFDELRSNSTRIASEEEAPPPLAGPPATLAAATRDMIAASRASTLLCTIVYLATAAAGYLLFGAGTAADVLENFDGSGALDSTVRIGYALHLLLVFPVIHFSLRQSVDSILFPRAAAPLASAAAASRYWTLTAALLAIVWLGSALVPNIWIAFQFTGATSGLSLGFIFPALVALRMWEGTKKKRRALAWSMLVMAAISSVLGFTTNVYNVITDHLN